MFPPTLSSSEFSKFEPKLVVSSVWMSSPVFIGQQICASVTLEIIFWVLCLIEYWPFGQSWDVWLNVEIIWEFTYQSLMNPRNGVEYAAQQEDEPHNHFLLILHFLLLHTTRNFHKVQNLEMISLSVNLSSFKWIIELFNQHPPFRKITNIS